MQRSKVRGADIKPDPRQFNRINAEKCIAYLRGIGVQISDDTADEWLDTQGVHRLLSTMRRSNLSFYEMSCRCGALRYEFVRERGKKVKTRTVTKDDDSAFCKACETFVGALTVLLYVVRVDGSELDYRSGVNRIAPYPWREMLQSRNGGDDA
jgi:hypothetical protein